MRVLSALPCVPPDAPVVPHPRPPLWRATRDSGDHPGRGRGSSDRQRAREPGRSEKTVAARHGQQRQTAKVNCSSARFLHSGYVLKKCVTREKRAWVHNQPILYHPWPLAKCPSVACWSLCCQKRLASQKCHTPLTMCNGNNIQGTHFECSWIGRCQ